MSESSTPTFIHALLDPERYPHAVDTVELVETHISWVLLAGDFAYKFKKPVNFGFVDFGTLHLRRFYCREELRRNQPLAAELYQAVVVLCGSEAAPTLHEDGEEPESPFEYAVRMRRFDEAERLDHRLAAGRATVDELERFAVELARFHAETAVADGQGTWGTPEAIIAPVRENIHGLRELLRSHPQLREGLGPALEKVAHWSEEAYRQLCPTFAARRGDGFVRECHGDLHLGNLAWHNGRVIAFDCIEFNPAFYWIDIINELAFLVMDTADRGHPGLGRRVLNRWLEWSGDYDGIALLDFYRIYRAMVRAKVAALRAGQTEGEDAEAALAEVGDYLHLAADFIRPHKPWLALTHGLSGSGKSRIGRDLIDQGEVVRLRSDVERKRLHGLAPDADSGSAVDAGLYTAEAGRLTYRHLLEQAEGLLAAGWPVVVDAAFLTREQREPFLALARERGVDGVILEAQAPEAELRRRIRERAAAGADPSEADEAVLDRQLLIHEPATDNEATRVLRIDTTSDRDPADLWRRVSGRDG